MTLKKVLAYIILFPFYLIALLVVIVTSPFWILSSLFDWTSYRVNEK